MPQNGMPAMKEQDLKYLLEQYLQNKATPDELEKLSSLLRTDPNADDTKDILLQMMQQETPVYPANRERWQQIQQEIIETGNRGTTPLHVAPVRTFKPYRWAAAAAAIVLIGLGALYFIQRRHSLPLTNTELATRDSVVSTMPGEQREIVLADGSRVWLNAASSISIPATFGNDDRTVKLTGEAFFDVTHNDNKPFRIHTGHVVTTVMGTAFDIKAYTQQHFIAVAVQRGKVKVQHDDQTLAVLEKGRQVRVNSATVFQESNTDSVFVASWRTGNLVYKDELLLDIAADLQRTFKDSISIPSPLLKETRMTISFNKKNGLLPALDMICRATDKQLSHKHGIYIIE